MRHLVLLLLAAMLLGACASDDAIRAGQTSSPTPSPAPTETETDAPEGDRLIRFPDPDRVVPHNAARLAEHIRKNEVKLRKAIEMWLDSGGDRRSGAGHRVALGALWQQRMFRTVTKHPDLSRKVLRRLPAWVARKVREHVSAGRGLRALASPIEPPVRMRVTPVDSHKKLRRFYKGAGRHFDIPVEILASLNFVESKFGRFMGPSSAGAKGPMQFMPSTWDIYGEGNIWDPHDAIWAAARYLSASGAPARMDDALWAYNHSDAYVVAIKTYAREMKRHPHSFYSYYFWQVFVRTTEGDFQLTGPGRDQ